MKKNDLRFILVSFLIWRLLLFVFLFLAIKFIPLQQNYLGGGRQVYLTNPWLWSWLNFDGEHYLAIAQSGYQPLSYFFFPVFPLINRFIGNILGGGQLNYALAGILVAHVSFLIALIGLWKLLALDYKRQVVQLTILLLLFFPTSFYFASYYTESIFLALAVWSFYLMRRDHWLKGSVLGGILSATRVIGVALAPAFLVELFVHKKQNLGRILALGLIPVGLLSYMWYLRVKTGDPLIFLHTVSIFGAQRSATFVILPQVFYRYFFKVLPAINYNYFPQVFVTYLETITAILFLVLVVAAFWKLRLSYAVYLALGYLIPSLAGSFSSLPRYVLVLFPAFVLGAIYVNKLPKVWGVCMFSILFVGLGLATCLFLRGYWIS